MKSVYLSFILIALASAFATSAKSKTFECEFPKMLSCKSEITSFCPSISTMKLEYKFKVDRSGSLVESTALIKGEWRDVLQDANDFVDKHSYQLFSMVGGEGNRIVIVVNKPVGAELDHKLKSPMIEYRFAGSCKVIK